MELWFTMKTQIKNERSIKEKPHNVPLLSIIIPAYNVESFIRDSITSALDQSLKNIEVIVVDDGSNDTTKEVIKLIERERQDTRLRVIHQENRGLSGARNTGINSARGKYIGFLDGDDVWHVEKASIQCNLMETDENIGITFSSSEYLTEDGSRTGRFLHCSNLNLTLHRMIKRNHIGNGSNPIVHNQCFKIAGNFDESLRSCEDYEMWCRILCLTGYRIKYISKPLTYYRIRKSSLSFDVNNFLLNAYRAVEKMRSDMPNVPKNVFIRAIAEHRRIAAWKAIVSGKQAESINIFLLAFKEYPQIIVKDQRALPTFLVAIMPNYVREHMLSAYNKA